MPIALEAEDELDAFNSEAVATRTRTLLGGATQPHTEGDAVDVHILCPPMGEVACAPLLHRFGEFLVGVADLGERDERAVGPLAQERERPRTDAREVHGREIFDESILILLAVMNDLGLELSLTVPRCPHGELSNPVYAEKPFAATVPVVG